MIQRCPCPAIWEIVHAQVPTLRPGLLLLHPTLAAMGQRRPQQQRRKWLATAAPVPRRPGSAADATATHTAAGGATGAGLGSAVLRSPPHTHTAPRGPARPQLAPPAVVPAAATAAALAPPLWRPACPAPSACWRPRHPDGVVCLLVQPGGSPDCCPGRRPASGASRGTAVVSSQAGGHATATTPPRPPPPSPAPPQGPYPALHKPTAPLYTTAAASPAPVARVTPPPPPRLPAAAAAADAPACLPAAHCPGIAVALPAAPPRPM